VNPWTQAALYYAAILVVGLGQSIGICVLLRTRPREMFAAMGKCVNVLVEVFVEIVGDQARKLRNWHRRRRGEAPIPRNEHARRTCLAILGTSPSPEG
jgi:hypothetical protein